MMHGRRPISVFPKFKDVYRLFLFILFQEIADLIRVNILRIVAHYRFMHTAQDAHMTQCNAHIRLCLCAHSEHSCAFPFCKNGQVVVTNIGRFHFTQRVLTLQIYYTLHVHVYFIFMVCSCSYVYDVRIVCMSLLDSVYVLAVAG